MKGFSRLNQFTRRRFTGEECWSLMEYLRHETTEKGDRRYQPYLPVAWVKQTRGGCWRGGRGADNVCWRSQHSHQTLETFNFRQRCRTFGPSSSKLFLLSAFLCRQFFFKKIFSFDFSLPFTWLYSTNVCDLFLSLLLYTSANLFSLAFHVTHKIAGAKQFLICLTKPSKQTASEEKIANLIFFRTQKSRNIFDSAIDFPRSGVFFV